MTRHFLPPFRETTDKVPELCGDTDARVVRDIDLARSNGYGTSQSAVFLPVHFRTRQSLQCERYRQIDVKIPSVTFTGSFCRSCHALGAPVERKDLLVPEEPFDAALGGMAGRVVAANRLRTRVRSGLGRREGFVYTMTSSNPRTSEERTSACLLPERREDRMECKRSTSGTLVVAGPRS